MSEQIILEQEQYDDLISYLRSPIPKEKRGKSIIIQDIHGLSIPFTSVKGKRRWDEEDVSIESIIYCDHIYLINDKKIEKDRCAICVNYSNERDSFEFIPVKDKRTYNIAKAYDMIKMGFVNLIECTNIKEDIENIYILVKEMESDDLKNTSP